MQRDTGALAGLAPWQLQHGHLQLHVQSASAVEPTASVLATATYGA